MQQNCNCSNSRPDRKQLLNKINEVSFAIDDIVLFLDTHPCDTQALQFYNEKLQIRQKLMKEYEQHFGPLTVKCGESYNDENWKWVLQPFPWENEGGKC